MSHITIKFVGAELPKICIPPLTQLGINLCQGETATPWLTLINLSHCHCDEVSDQLSLHPGKNQIALLAPEQTELAATAMQLGAQDYLLLPIDAQQLLSLVQRLQRLEQVNTGIIVASPVSRQLLMLAHRAAMTEATVLLTGESGTGKEPLARYIHQNSTRAEQAFIAVNCAAIPESILESILFGHVKGAFTGASCDQPGKFELANGGTLLLDEIGEMPLLLQAKLLRVLQEREVERLGSHKTISLDIRVIASTNRDLRQAVQAGHFREDLFYRLDVLPLRIAPLRNRRDDIMPLAQHFLHKYRQLAGEQSCYFSDAARHRLLTHAWPGNVRELENTIQRALVMRRGQALQVVDLGLEPSVDVSSFVPLGEPSLKASKKQAEFQYILDTLKRFNGHRSQSAESLGMTTRALRYKLVQMREQGIDIEQALVQSGYAA